MTAPLRHQAYRWVSRAWSFLGRAGSPPGLRALLYHCVGARLQDDPYGTSVSLQEFARHIAYLDSIRSRWEPAPFAQPRSGAPTLAVTFDDGYKDVLTTAAPILVERRLPFSVFVTTGFIRGGSPLYLDPSELKELSRLPGAAIGSHGASHRPLARLNDAELREELSASRKWLEDLLGAPVTTLSYPHGSVDRRVRDAAQEAGYVLGGTSRYGVNAPGRDPLLLCRTEITAWDTTQDLDLKVSGAWDWHRFRRPDPADH